MPAMQTLYPLLAVVARLPARLAVVRRHREPRCWACRTPRTYGSGNPGATNVLRSGSKKAAVLTLLLDALKGWLPGVPRRPVRRSLRAGGRARRAGRAGGTSRATCGPVFFRFKGGKGLSRPAAGVLLGFNPLLGLATLLTWIVIAFFFPLLVRWRPS
jgi:glycerol-3-phosphate acyltransferase PlsY